MLFTSQVACGYMKPLKEYDKTKIEQVRNVELDVPQKPEYLCDKAKKGVRDCITQCRYDNNLRACSSRCYKSFPPAGTKSCPIPMSMPRPVPIPK